PRPLRRRGRRSNPQADLPPSRWEGQPLWNLPERKNERDGGRLVSPAKSRAQTVIVSRWRKRGAGRQLRVNVEHGLGADNVRKRWMYEGTLRRESRSMMFIRLCESSQTRIRTYTRSPIKRTARILMDGFWVADV